MVELFWTKAESHDILYYHKATTNSKPLYLGTAAAREVEEEAMAEAQEEEDGGVGKECEEAEEGDKKEHPPG